MKLSCGSCGKPFEAKRASARFCSAACRKRSSRKGQVVDLPLPAPEAAEPSEAAAELVRATEKDLRAAKKLDSVLGQQAMVLARKMGNLFDTGSATAAVSRELRAVMAEVLGDVKQPASPVNGLRDELAARRRA